MSATEPQVQPEERRIKAIAVSRGIGIGPAVFLPEFDLHSQERSLAPNAIEAELDRLRHGVKRAQVNLNNIANIGSLLPTDSISGIFDTHLLILESFAAKVEGRIKTACINAEWAIDAVLKEALERQGTHTSDHIREKQVDLKDVATGILDELRNVDRLEFPAGSVIIAREIRPSSVMEIGRTAPAAIVSRRGGWTSHSSILARELGIPMVTGADVSVINTGDIVIANGYSGEIIVRPGAMTLADVQSTKSKEKSQQLARRARRESSSSVQTEIVVRVNVESTLAYEAARNVGALGIGLFRSESLVAKSGKLPTEEQQFAGYAAIAAAVGETGVNIRTFDIGSDTTVGETAVERNPALGLRSIRLSLTDPNILITQLRAILRANEHGNISVVIPMVNGVSEVHRFREILNETATSMANEGFSPQMPRIGAMIEVPSAVLTAREIAAEVDFICLGTNDLVQYLLAVDRDNERVAEWYQTLHPAVLRAIREVVAAGVEAGIPVTACGEMAGSPFYIPLLIGLGIREFSMSGGSVGTARHLISGIAIADAESVTREALDGKTASEIDALLRRLYTKHWPDLFPNGFLASQR